MQGNREQRGDVGPISWGKGPLDLQRVNELGTIFGEKILKKKTEMEEKQR